MFVQFTMKLHTASVCVLFTLLVSAVSAEQLVVYGLRPYEITGLDNKDTASDLGDIFLQFGDRVAQRLLCAKNESAFFCKCEVTCVDNVYTQYEIDAPGGVQYPYGLCNPVGTSLKHPDYKCVRDDGFHMGSASIRTRYPNVSALCFEKRDPPYLPSCWWKYNSSKHIGGEWYSHPAAGNCDTHPTNCSWSIAETKKIVNESCINDGMFGLVEKHGADCLDGCAKPYNTSSECYLTCFFDAMLQIPAANLKSIWDAAFASEDPAKGGCPARPFPRGTVRPSPRHPSLE